MTNDPWQDEASVVPGGFGQPANPWFGSTAPRLNVAAEPPRLWLIASVVASLASGGLAAVLGRDIIYAGIGWLLAGPVALLLLATFNWRETERRSRANAIIRDWVRPAQIVGLLLALAAVLGSAVRIAFWSGRHLRWFG